ncbi:DUF397 domain-containing protein [Streptomyces xiamenensis]|uniref:DUF397 domain-containing protein n=1 Tax=Streptomyces TaxID=1883 RepID=UPI00342E3D0D
MGAEDWQISSYCQEGNSCIGLSATDGGAIRLRESDRPTEVLVGPDVRVAALLAAIKGGKLGR